MATDRMLDDLAADLRPVTPRSAWRDGAVLAAVGLAEVALFFLMGLERPHMTHAMAMPSFWWKFICCGLLTVAAAVTTLRSFEPSSSPRNGLKLLAWLIGATLLTGWIVDAVQTGGTGSLAMRLMWRHGVDCVIWMLILSLPPLIALGILMRRGAATDRRGSALAIGATGAAWSAFVFSFGCGHDDPLYIAVWYSVGCLLIAAVARLLLPRLIRW